MRRGWFLPIAATLGFSFLYAPIISMVVFSFNENRLVTVWSGFSTKWYGELFNDPQMLGAAWLSLQIAAISATIALVLGTLAAVALVRFRSFRGRTLFSGMVSAPMVMPDVITGLSMLLLFVAMESLLGWPAGRGMLTIVIAHSTFAMAYICVVVQSRLSDF
ncbi:MAG: transporter permease subunit, partial [Devosia sp.]|nr:transporter permease subunit [Devosia sp.]